MSWKQTAQHSIADMLAVGHNPLSELDDAHSVINWKGTGTTLAGLYSSQRGAPAYPPLMMLKTLIPQAWYSLIDEALENKLPGI